MGKVLKLRPRFAGSEHQSHGIGRQTPRDERERERRALIQPLCVLEHTQHRLLLGQLRQQPEYGQSDEEWVRGGTAAQPKDNLKRLALWVGQEVKAVH